MTISHLRLQNFRSYSELELELPPGKIGIEGSNGEGKTNLLEALHLIMQGWSFRTRKDREMIQWDQNELLIFLEKRGEPKESFSLTLDRKGQKMSKSPRGRGKGFSNLVGNWPVISIGPDDIQLVEGAPELRRRFLDSLLCQESPQNMELLRIYQRNLKQRNALLSFGQFDPLQLDSLTEQISENAAKITQKRASLCEKLHENANQSHLKLSSNAENLSLKYRSTGFSELNRVPNTQDYLQFFHENRKRELELRRTLAGPHIDDLQLKINDKSLRNFGSRGQCRSAALSLRLAAAEMINLAFQLPPILLLDDIFAELDMHRRNALGQLIEQSEQVFMATPCLQELPFSPDCHFVIKNRKIQRIS